MKSGFRLFFVLCALLVPVFQASAQQGPVLDTGSLRASMAYRVNLILSERGIGQADAITVDAITIEAVKPVTLGGMTLFAVKMSLHAEGVSSMFPQPEQMVLLTDASGSYQFGMVTDIATGDEAAMVQALELTRIAFPDHLAKPYVKGTGTKKVSIVTDPFCGYCRKAHALLMEQLAAIDTLSLIHFPLPSHLGANVAVWIMEYAREEAHELYPLVVDFAYTALRAPSGLNPIDAQREVVKQFLTKFPKLTSQSADAFFFYLKGKYEAQDMATRKELQRLQISGTPVVLIDGQTIQGYDPKAILNHLRK